MQAGPRDALLVWFLFLYYSYLEPNADDKSIALLENLPSRTSSSPPEVASCGRARVSGLALQRVERREWG